MPKRTDCSLKNICKAKIPNFPLIICLTTVKQELKKKKKGNWGWGGESMLAAPINALKSRIYHPPGLPDTTGISNALWKNPKIKKPPRDSDDKML